MEWIKKVLDFFNPKKRKEKKKMNKYMELLGRADELTTKTTSKPNEKYAPNCIDMILVCPMCYTECRNKAVLINHIVNEHGLSEEDAIIMASN